MKISFILFASIILVVNSTFAQIAKYREYIGVNAQNLHDYGAATAFPNNLVADDFGPRKLDGKPYDWHSGIDFNAPAGVVTTGGDAGDLILAIEGGTVSPTSQINEDADLKWITIEGVHNITYEHVFPD